MASRCGARALSAVDSATGRVCTLLPHDLQLQSDTDSAHRSCKRKALTASACGPHDRSVPPAAFTGLTERLNQQYITGVNFYKVSRGLQLQLLWIALTAAITMDCPYSCNYYGLPLL